MSMLEAREVARQTFEYLKKEIIRARNSPFASHIILVKKMDDTYCTSNDYHAFNKITVKTS